MFVFEMVGGAQIALETISFLTYFCALFHFTKGLYVYTVYW